MYDKIRDIGNAFAGIFVVLAAISIGVIMVSLLVDGRNAIIASKAKPAKLADLATWHSECLNVETLSAKPETKQYWMKHPSNTWKQSPFIVAADRCRLDPKLAEFHYYPSQPHKGQIIDRFVAVYH